MLDKVKRFRIQVSAGIAGICAAIALPFSGGLRNPDSLSTFVKENNHYSVFSSLSLLGVRESGMDRDKDGRYDFWTVCTESTDRYSELPLCLEVWSANGDETPDYLRVWIGREGADKQDLRSAPLFGYFQVTRENEGEEELRRIEIILGDRDNPKRYFHYYDIGHDGIIDVRRLVEDGVVKESHVYFEDMWARIVSTERPYVRIESGGEFRMLTFREGHWKTTEDTK